MYRQSNRITFSILTGILLLSAALMLLIAYQIGFFLPASGGPDFVSTSIAVLP